MSSEVPVPRESVSLVVPIYNEAEVIPHLIGELETYRASRQDIEQVILVDDGSTDESPGLIRKLTEDLDGYVLLSFSRNFGHQLAITAGLELVTSDAAVIIDADLQDPLHVISEMIDRWHEGYEVVYGLRRKRKGEAAFKRHSATAFYRLFRWMTDVDMPLDTGDFRLVSRPVIDAYAEIGEQKPFVRGLVSWLGFKQIGVSYDRVERVAGTTKYTLRKMVGLAVDSITSFSQKPLQIAVRLGLVTAVLSVAGGISWVLLAKYVFETAISGWASLMLVITFFGGLNLFFVGLVGLYLARVFDEVRGRPRFIVRGTWRSRGSKFEETEKEVS